MCDELAAIAGVDIASVYVREADRLVMRGNHGFAATAIGTTLAIGEGITGLVAECMRPVSAAHAAAEVAYRHIPGLGEERFPVFAGVPLISGGQVIGVLVLQRSSRPFATDEVTLATALGAPVTLAIERRNAAAICPGSPTSAAPCSAARRWCRPRPRSPAMCARRSISIARPPACATISAARCAGSAMTTCRRSAPRSIGSPSRCATSACASA
jgi:hypothetical protein